MNKAARISITAVAFLVGMFLAGALREVYQESGLQQGGIYGLLSVGLFFGPPYLAWWLTGRSSKKD